MKKKVLAVTLGLVLAISVSACKKKEQQPVPKASTPIQGHDITMTKTEVKVVVPDSVKGKWSAVKIIVEDKMAKKSQEFTVNLNSDLKIPDSNLRVSVGEFLPNFRMDVGTITSMSNEPNNPAVGIKVYEGDKEIFKGWLYAKFPDIHPFEHPKYGLALKEGVK